MPRVKRSGIGWTRARKLVFERDRGVCKRCGLNTEHLRQAITWYYTWLLNRYRLLTGSTFAASVEAKTELHAFIKALSIPHHLALRHDLWQAHHRVAVIDGGDHRIEDLETVCLPCHKKETALLARRLAKTKRLEKKGMQFGYVPQKFLALQEGEPL